MDGEAAPLPAAADPSLPPIAAAPTAAEEPAEPMELDELPPAHPLAAAPAALAPSLAISWTVAAIASSSATVNHLEIMAPCPVMAGAAAAAAAATAAESASPLTTSESDATLTRLKKRVVQSE